MALETGKRWPRILDSVWKASSSSKKARRAKTRVTNLFRTPFTLSDAETSCSASFGNMMRSSGLLRVRCRGGTQREVRYPHLHLSRRLRTLSEGRRVRLSLPWKKEVRGNAREGRPRLSLTPRLQMNGELSSHLPPPPPPPSPHTLVILVLRSTPVTYAFPFLALLWTRLPRRRSCALSRSNS